jgi:hypothetical protein
MRALSLPEVSMLDDCIVPPGGESAAETFSDTCSG